MKLQEYQSKQIFAASGITVPKGGVATTPEEAYRIAARFAAPVVIKAQVLIGGRGKAGGIKLADTAEEAEEAAAEILGMNLKGLTVKQVLVEAQVLAAQEFYLGITVDRAAAQPVMIACAEGGVEIEEVARHTPEKVVKVAIDPLLGLQDYQTRELAFAIGLKKGLLRDFVLVAHQLYTVFVGYDTSLTEINPLVVLGDGRLVALDAKIVLDDNALFRHPDLAAMRTEEESPAEAEARQHGLSYIKLAGEIGCLVNGAGLAMATMDVIKLYGGEPANFLDIGGGAQAEKVAGALHIILSDAKVQAVLINIFGGITRCDEVARGILTALRESPAKVPVIVRLVGTNEKEGRRVLSEANLVAAATLEEAAQKAVAFSKGEGGSYSEAKAEEEGS